MTCKTCKGFGYLLTAPSTCSAGGDRVPCPVCTTSQRLDAATVERLTRIRTSMALLQQNSEGCALNHYGSDAETHGFPAWLTDTNRDLEALTALLADNGEKHGG